MYYKKERSRIVNADVSLAFKGYNSDTITFKEDLEWGNSEIGTEYLLFLNKKDNSFESPLCSPKKTTAGLDKDTLIETLSDESTNVIEFDVTYRADNPIQNDNSRFSWGMYLLISIFIILIILAGFIFYRRRNINK